MLIKRYINLYFLFPALFLVLPCQSQPACTFKHYSTNEGLSHNGIMCILEDHKGFMWFGKWDGLNRFDGYNFMQLRPVKFKKTPTRMECPINGEKNINWIPKMHKT